MYVQVHDITPLPDKPVGRRRLPDDMKHNRDENETDNLGVVNLNAIINQAAVFDDVRCSVFVKYSSFQLSICSTSVPEKKTYIRRRTITPVGVANVSVDMDDESEHEQEVRVQFIQFMCVTIAAFTDNIAYATAVDRF